jgi:hypothetical protein
MEAGDLWRKGINLMSKPSSKDLNGAGGRNQVARCGAHAKRSGKPCTHVAGFRTDHPGQGRCWLHGGRSPIKHGLYSQVQSESLRKFLALVDANATDPMDLMPEVRLLRAMLLELLNRNTEAGFLSPDDLSVASILVERVGRQIERIHRMKQTSAVTWEAVNLLIEKMGMVLTKHVKDTDLVQAITRDWMDIEVPLASTR